MSIHPTRSSLARPEHAQQHTWAHPWQSTSEASPGHGCSQVSLAVPYMGARAEGRWHHPAQAGSRDPFFGEEWWEMAVVTTA